MRSVGIWTKVRNFLRRLGGAHPRGRNGDWSEWGQLQQAATVEPPAGYESPGRLIEEGERLGHGQGAVRNDESVALGTGSGAHRFIEGAVDVRKSVAKRAAWRRIAPAYRRSRMAPSRVEGVVARIGEIREWGKELKDEVLPNAQRRLQDAMQELAGVLDEFMVLPRLVRGYFPTAAPVGIVNGAVVCFDAFVLHGALTTSGLDVVSVWGTTATVAAAIAAANHGFGVLAGAIGLAAPPRHRIRIAVVLFAAGFGAMLVAFVLLMVFRAEATAATNGMLQMIAEGKVPDHVAVFISPLWMGPLQVGGSLAAITLTAFWTMAKEGREFTALKIVPAEERLQSAAAEVGAVTAQIAGTRRALEQAVVAQHEIGAEGAGAEAEVAAQLQALEATITGEDSLGRAAEGRYRSAYDYSYKLYENAGLFRMATASVRRWFSRRWRSRGEADLPRAGDLHEFDLPLRRARFTRSNSTGNGGDPVGTGRQGR